VADETVEHSFATPSTHPLHDPTTSPIAPATAAVHHGDGQDGTGSNAAAAARADRFERAQAVGPAHGTEGFL